MPRVDDSPVPLPFELSLPGSITGDTARNGKDSGSNLTLRTALVARETVAMVNFLVNKWTRPSGVLDIRWTARPSHQH